MTHLRHWLRPAAVLQCSSQVVGVADRMPPVERWGEHAAAGISRCSRWCGGSPDCGTGAAGDAGDGYLGGRSAQTDVPMLAALRQGLAENSYVEGQNVAIEYRWGEGQYDSLPVGSQITLSSKSRSSHTYGDESANQNPTDLGGRLA